MSELARVLRDARKVQNIALDEAERATKIRRRYLEAIEAGDFDQLPDGPPARGFVKNYARFLSLDGDQAIADFEAEFGVPVIYAREHIPPPPNHSRQRRRSSYTQLEAPRLHYKGRLPAPNSPELDGYDPRDERARDERERDERNERDRDNQPSGFSRNAIGGDYNLGFDDDDEMARYRPRNYRTDEDDRGSEGRDGGREGSRRRVLPPLKQRLRANKSSFRLQGKSGPPKGMSLSSGVPEISTVLPSKSRMGGLSRPAVNLPRIPQQVFGFLGGLVAIGALAALVVLVILPAARTSSLFTRFNTPAATRSASAPAIAVTMMVPVRSANTPAPQAQAESNASTAVLPDVSANPQGNAAAAPETVPAAVPVRTDGIQLALDAREHAWVRVKVDGNVVYESMPPIGPTMTWSAKSKISIETGNAGAFEAIVNGVRTGAVGERNTVARKVWDLSAQAKDGE